MLINTFLNHCARSPPSAAFPVAVAIFVAIVAWKAYRPVRRIPGVPIIGYDGTPASLKAAKLRYRGHADDVIREGYEQVCVLYPVELDTCH